MAAPTMGVATFLARVAELLRAGLPRQLWLEASVVAVRAGRYGHTIELVDPGAEQTLGVPILGFRNRNTRYGSAPEQLNRFHVLDRLKRRGVI